MIKDIEYIGGYLFNNSPYFAEFFFNLNMEYSTEVPTVGVAFKHSKMKILFNQTFWDDLPLDNKFGIIFHEILHILFLSFKRGENYNKQIFNMASDYAINYEIKKTNFSSINLSLPTNGLFIENLEGYTGKIIAEEIYEFIYNNASKDIPNFDDHTFLDQFEELSDSEKDVFIEAIKDIENAAKKKEYGSMSSSMVDFIKGITSPKVNWKALLRKNISVMSSTSKNFYEMTFEKTNRRDDYIPGKRYYSNKLIVAVDTSGSIIDYVEKFFSEIEAISSTMEEIVLIQCDCEVKSVSSYKKNDWRKIKVLGNGGTSVQPVFDYIKEKKLVKYPLVYFTDGEFNHDFNNYNIKTLWITTGTKIPYGKNVVIN